MYSIGDYGDFIADSGRTGPYAEALRAAVGPDSVVLDIGAGTGIFSLLACRFGARKVYAVEPSDTVQVAREIAAANGYADRIDVIQSLSQEIELPEKATVVVSDLRGPLPLYGSHLPAVIDARERLMATGGRLIPLRDTLMAAVIEAPELYRRFAGPWEENDYGLDMGAARKLAVNTITTDSSKSRRLILEGRPWARIDYAAVTGPDVSGTLEWTVGRAGAGHGLLLWFDAELADGIGFSNAPGLPTLIYGRLFFPFEAPVALDPGDRVTVSLRADLVGDDYVWGWKTKVREEKEPGRLKADFSQSTFHALPLTPRGLRDRKA